MTPLSLLPRFKCVALPHPPSSPTKSCSTCFTRACRQYADNHPQDLSFSPGIQIGQSVAGKGVKLLYKPYMDFLWSSLVSGASGLKCQPLESDLKLQNSMKGPQGAKVYNWLFCSTHLRRIRLTYFDAGIAGQAFNSLLYPDYRYDFPLLGIDLLYFGRRKILCVIDFQPLSQDPSYLDKYTRGLAPIHQEYADLCSKMTTRIYNENKFFSKYLIFFRSNEGAAEPALQVPNGSFFEVYMSYVNSYLSWLCLLDPQDDLSFMASVQRSQANYDKYSSERDPAIKLFSTYFGKEWSEQLTDCFLFPLAKHFDETGISP